ncbi:MAG TPA: hypothetical protein VHL59_01735 [Thermoanaerobaculia bacterium]|nr:hypothetical protein [Thermoanaerobaculia bacterium]
MDAGEARAALRDAPHLLGVLEKGGNTPSLATVMELADVFNVDVAEIVRELQQGRRQEARVQRAAARATAK